MHRVALYGHELDDLLVEYKNQAANITKSKFANTVVASELAIPFIKGRLPWARSVLSAWESVGHIRHHKPLPKLLASLYALLLSWIGYGRIGAGLWLQTEKGLRPSELLGLMKEHVLLPSALMSKRCIVLNLGMKTGTKLKRPQAVIVSADVHPRSFLALQQLVATTPERQLLFGGLTLTQYQTLFKWLNACMQWADFSPHSPRAGFASDSVLEGKQFVQIREEGRWTADSSLRIYLDVVATAYETVQHDISDLSDKLQQLNQQFDAFFCWWPQCSLRQTLDIPAFWKHMLPRAVQKWPVPGQAHPCPSLAHCLGAVVARSSRKVGQRRLA